jgi:hypothetical protein
MLPGFAVYMPTASPLAALVLSCRLLRVTPRFFAMAGSLDCGSGRSHTHRHEDESTHHLAGMRGAGTRQALRG